MSQTEKTILIVDDTEDTHDIIKENLHDFDFLKIRSAYDGEEAIEDLQNNGPVDLMLVDLMMPNLDGYSMLERIHKTIIMRLKYTPLKYLGQSNTEVQNHFHKQDILFTERLRRTPVLIISASDQKDDVVKSREFKVKGYLIKPFQYEFFMDRVGHALNTILL